MRGRRSLLAPLLSLVAVSPLLLVLCWVNAGVSGGTIISPYGCASANFHQRDTSPWLSVSRGPGFYLNDVFQYWLTQAFIYGLDTTSEWLEAQQWQLPSEVRPVNGLVLTYYDNAPADQELRVVLLNASNCLLEYYITSVRPPSPPKYRLTTTYCFDGGLPLWQKIVPDDSSDMTNIKFLYLVSLTHVAVVSADTIQPVDIIKLPAGEIRMTSVVGAVYRHNEPGTGDQLFIIRGSNQTRQTSSEFLYYRVSQGPQLTFDHVTYLQGASDTLFTNGNIMKLYWTQVVANQNDTQGLLYGYGLLPPHHFRQGSLDFSAWPQNPQYQDIDFSVVMASHDANGNACLQVFFHCPGDASDPLCHIG